MGGDAAIGSNAGGARGETLDRALDAREVRQKAEGPL